MNVYDFDNTIYDGESCLHMFFYFVRRDPALIKSVPRVLKAFAEYKKCAAEIEALKTLLSDSEMRDMAQTELDEKRNEASLLEEKIKMLLLPRDENDERGVHTLKHYDAFEKNG